MIDQAIKTVLPAALALLLVSAAPATAGEGHARIVVDASRTVGRFKDLRGVNGVPDMTFLDKRAFDPRRPAPVDISAGYREARINIVRTHDSQGAADLDPSTGPLPSIAGPFGPPPDIAKLADLNSIFPDAKADPADPKSYNFGPTDKLIAGIEAIGAETLFRLGRSGMTGAPPPADLDRYGEVIRHVVLHYNKGWAGGFHYAIRRWEVWNEPDLGQIFWRGTPEQYYALYATAAKAVKSADPQALVGGPTIAVINEPTPYREGFLAYVRDHHLPLDFFSWHWYSTDADDPYDFVRLGRQMRTLLDSYGFKHTTSVLDEWNYDIHSTPKAPTHHAAFVVSAIVYMQDAPIDEEELYRADRDFGPAGSTPSKLGQGLIALGRMADTPIRLSTRGADTNGLAVQAGRSADGRLIQVLISNYEITPDHRAPRTGDNIMHEHGLFDLKLLARRAVSYGPNQGYDLKIAGLNPKARYVRERYRITADQDFSLVGRDTVSGGVLKLQADLPPPGIELVVLKRLGRGANR